MAREWTEEQLERWRIRKSLPGERPPWPELPPLAGVISTPRWWIWRPGQRKAMAAFDSQPAALGCVYDILAMESRRKA
ncbi:MULTISPECIES: hypothetical protein [Mycobacteroides]|uniref:hypothetical protein n=1 Tax=Mycobacteroides TaxID=670516 RepID=UPI0010425FEF|nr:MULTISPECIES: hypothetical protein [Mycobacteroides]